MRYALVLMALALVCGCQTVKRPAPVHDAAWQKQQLDNIREAVLRYQISNNKTGIAANAYYIFTDSPYSDTTLLARFAACRPPVLPGSKAPVRHKMQEEWSDKKMFIYMQPIHFTAPDQAQIRSTLLCGNLCGNGAVYTLQFSGGKWSVKGIASGVVF